MSFELIHNPWTPKSVHIVLDWETMSTAHNAAPVQLAACAFGHPEIGEVRPPFKFFNSLIDPKSSEAAGLHVDVDTMRWWGTKDRALREKVFSGTVPLREVMDDFATWLGEVSPDPEQTFFWGKGPEFDCALLREVWETALECKFPYSFRNFDSVRTVMRCLPRRDLELITSTFNLNNPTAVPHDAYWDTAYQAELVKSSLLLLGR